MHAAKFPSPRQRMSRSSSRTQERASRLGAHLATGRNPAAELASRPRAQAPHAPPIASPIGIGVQHQHQCPPSAHLSCAHPSQHSAHPCPHNLPLPPCHAFAPAARPLSTPCPTRAPSRGGARCWSRMRPFHATTTWRAARRSAAQRGGRGCLAVPKVADPPKQLLGTYTSALSGIARCSLAPPRAAMLLRQGRCVMPLHCASPTLQPRGEASLNKAIPIP